MRNLAVISILVFACSSSLVAQIENSTTMDRKYIPPSGSIFNTDVKASSAPINSISFEYNNIVKSEMSLLSRGVIAFNYERKLFNPISVELGAGVTTFPDYVLYIRASVSDVMDEMLTPYTNGPGYFYKIGFRYNYNEMGDGGFMGIYFRNITHNYYDQGRSYDQYFQASRDLYYDYGVQFPMGNRSTGELSFGIGYRFLSFYEGYQSGFQYRIREDFDIHFFANVGVKIGFGF